MNDDDICFTPALDLAGAIADKRLSPVEITDAVLARIERLEPTVNAFATLTAEAARDAARRAEAELMRGPPQGRLHGVPVTIKDLAETAGIPTERGSFVHRGEVPERDAAVVTRLRDAGAIVLGKTTTSEFGWKGVSQSPLTGITSNPWKPGFNAGASSAGAGAGAAAGYGPLHHGSDGAGSIRMPAHFCGVFGLKPTFGRIPNVPLRNNDQVSHHGPLTRTVADAALMLAVMAGPHPLDHYSLEAGPADYVGRLHEPQGTLKVAFSADLGHARVDAEVADIVAKAARAIEDLVTGDGGHMDAAATPFGPRGPEIVRFFWAAHEQLLVPYLREFEARMDPGLLACIRAGADMSALDYLTMRERKHEYVTEVLGFFEDWDFLVTPAVSVAAFPAERLQPEHWPQHPWDWLSWAEFSYPFNLSGNPAAIVPAGFTADGLPVGLQIVGRRFDDLGVLQLAARFEQARPWAQHRPAL
jgi:aspartyl-tRNA(Asn)/glutamyl-tRNA(Gln) amidotransferase subunit A